MSRKIKSYLTLTTKALLCYSFEEIRDAPAFSGPLSQGPELGPRHVLHARVAQALPPCGPVPGRGLRNAERAGVAAVASGLPAARELRGKPEPWVEL